MSPVPERDHSPRRAEILEVAALLFRRSGYRETSVRDIANALDIKSASLYYYFDNKHLILFAIMHGLMEQFVAEVTPVLASGRDPMDAIGEVVAAHLRFDFANLDRVIVSARERRSLSSELQRPINRLRARHRHALEAVIIAGIDEQVFSPADHRIAAAAVLDLLTGVKEWYRPPRDGRLDDLIATYRRYALAVLGCASERKVAITAGRSRPRISTAHPSS
jgi:AcrR family transcriptional regulator